MRLTTKTDYSFRVLIYLQQKRQKAKIQEISDFFNISKNHLSVVVNQLSELGYIISSSGPKGGIEFNPQFADKTVGELIREIEPLDVLECLNGEPGFCKLIGNCRLQSEVEKAMYKFLEELDKCKISDLA